MSRFHAELRCIQQIFKAGDECKDKLGDMKTKLRLLFKEGWKVPSPAPAVGTDLRDALRLIAELEGALEAKDIELQKMPRLPSVSASLRTDVGLLRPSVRR